MTARRGCPRRTSSPRGRPKAGSRRSGGGALRPRRRRERPPAHAANVTNARPIVILTSSSHTVTMDTVTVAELKAKLSYYLREVREGRSFTVLSRDIPVATLGPYEAEGIDDLEIIEPTEDPALWGQVDLPPLGRSIDVVALIREDRDDRDLRLDRVADEAIEAGRRADEPPDAEP